jgi:hypothetical protein
MFTLIYVLFDRMCGDGSIPPTVQEINVTTEVVEVTEKPKSDKDDDTGAQDTAILEKKAAPQEETSVAQDNASKKYVILTSQIY